jgi:hypothetical protein
LKRNPQEVLSVDEQLCRACYTGHVFLVRGLLSLGADPRYADENGKTPLHCAADSLSDRKLEIIELLVGNGADRTARDKIGMTPLDYAKLSRQHAQEGTWPALEAALGLGAEGPNLRPAFMREL